jgi:hypothetical protein
MPVAIGRNKRLRVSAAMRAGLLFIAFIRADAARAEAAWCASIYGPDGGYVTCTYATRDQCVAAASGVGGICFANPADTAHGAPWTRPSHR